ncbi:MAG: MerR family transcriptional regulator [Spirochaetales bacterium]|nr:MerR family transcriptional regulator [Spirochaetales bacterium]
MYSIGQFSVMTKIPPKTLRYYDEINLLTPATTDAKTGYRYYDDDSVVTAQQILVYKSCQLPLTDIKDVLEKRGSGKGLAGILKTQLVLLEERMAAMDKSRHLLSEMLRSFETAGPNRVMVLKKDERPVLSIRARGGHETIGETLSTLFETVFCEGFEVTGPHTIVWHEERNFDADTMDMELFIPVNRKERIENDYYRIRPQNKYCTLLHSGGLPAVSDSYRLIYEFIRQKGLQITGPAEETYTGGGKFINPLTMKVEIAVPVGEAV